MLKNVTGSETNTFDEVNDVLNRIIDAFNSNEAYNIEVDEYNKSLDKTQKSSNKKGGK